MRYLILRLLIEMASFLPYNCLPSILHTSISCDKNDFLLKISFNESFTGLIYTEQGSPNCVYVNASMQPSNSYQVKIPLVGCETRRNSEGNLENEIVVQNGASFSPGADRKFLLTCIPAAPKFSMVTVAFGGVTIDQSATTASSVAGTPKYAQLLYPNTACRLEYFVTVIDASKPGRTPLRRPLAVGDKVIYSVFVAEPASARIGRCWATDGSSNLELSDKDGCSLQRNGDVWNDFAVTSNSSGTQFENAIKAWAFPTNSGGPLLPVERFQCATRRRRELDADRVGLANALGSLDNRLISDQLGNDDLSPPIPVHGTLRIRRGPAPKTAASSQLLLCVLFSLSLLLYS